MKVYRQIKNLDKLPTRDKLELLLKKEKKELIEKIISDEKNTRLEYNKIDFYKRQYAFIKKLLEYGEIEVNVENTDIDEEDL